MPRWAAASPTIIPLLLLVATLLGVRTAGAASRPAFTIPAKETLTYSVEWRLIHAGNLRLEWERTTDSATPRYQAKLSLESVGLVSRLFKVQDLYTSQMVGPMCAVSSQLTAREGSRHRETAVTFDYARGKASSLEKDLKKNTVAGMQEVDIPACVHDIIGALYRLRTLRLDPGQQAQVPVSDGKKSMLARGEAQEREEIRTPAGVFKTIRYEAFVFNDVLYRRKGRLFVWITDDARRLPVQIRVRMQLHIGTVTLQLDKEEKP